MSKKKWSSLLAIFFLVQNMMPSSILSFESSPLNPPTNMDVNSSSPVVKEIYDAVCLGIFLYGLDTAGRLSKEDMRKSYSRSLINSRVHFDLANMDLGKKGWTRCYPFSIGNKAFIMRIFLTAERAYQPSAPILYEGSIASPAVTFQVLPSLNDILYDRRIRPFRTYSTSQVGRSP